MSRTFVTNADRSVSVEVVQDDEGYARAVCEAGDWATEPGRCDTIADVVEEAGIHLGRAHP